MIKKYYIAFLESDLKMLVFILAIICLLFNQNNLIELVEEFELEKTMVEDYDTESEEKSSSEKFMDDDFLDNHTSIQRQYLGAQIELLRQIEIAVLANGYLVEIPLPPPEFH